MMDAEQMEKLDPAKQGPLPGAGHNKPPSSVEIIQAEIRAEMLENHGHLLHRHDELIDETAAVPETIDDEETAGMAADFVKKCTALYKTADAARVAAKEEYLVGERAVDGFFKPVTTGMVKVRKVISARLTDFGRRKAAEERRVREEAERKARAAAEAARRKAAEAAIEAARARAAAEKAERERDEFEVVDAAIASDLAQDEATAAKLAADAAADAAAATKAANVKAAAISRTRGDHGAVSSLRTTWVHGDVDRAELDLEALRQHISMDALEKAVRSAIRAGARELPGVLIYETTHAIVR